MKTALTLLAALIAVICIFNAVSLLRAASRMTAVTGDGIDYPIRGVDVSSYQGNINWETIASQNISFAYIKATEGSSHVDKKAAVNLSGARAYGIKVGAYHFMSFETSGSAQAQNFINTVGKSRDMLPPVIDVEYYGRFNAFNVSQSSVDRILSPLISALKRKYGKDPVIYTTPYIYTHCISGNYDNDIWIADSSFSRLSDGRAWKFCQYSSKGHLNGMSGGVEHIDLDVYNGSALSLAAY